MIQATGKVAETLIEALKSHPVSLPLVVVNMLAMGAVGYVLYIVAERTTARDALIMELTRSCGVTKDQGTVPKAL